jgi:DNA-binding PadR family transcriptional regulator
MVHAMTLSPEYAFLGFLAQQPAHGYDLHQRLMTELGQVWHVSISQTYNILNRLERQGFITGTLQEQARRPDRCRFRLTAAGRRRFETWLRAVSPGGQVRAVRLEFTTRLYFAGALHPDLVPTMVEDQANEIRDRLANLQSIQADLPVEQVLNQLNLRLRLRQLTVLLDWVGECQAALAESPGGSTTVR